MKIRNITLSQLNAALKAVNRSHGYKLIWNRAPEPLNRKGTHFACTLRSAVSSIKGSRTAAPMFHDRKPRNLVAASWHAHGYFFESILAQSPAAVIRHGRGVIDQYGGNWVDWDCGPQCRPCMISETSIGE